MRKIDHTYWLVFPLKRVGSMSNGWQSAGNPFIFNRSLTSDNRSYLIERAKEECPDYEKLEFHKVEIKPTIGINKPELEAQE
jgi:hypothetical protein